MADPNDELISIPLHPKHWVILIAAIEKLNEAATSKIADLKNEKVDVGMMPNEMVTALAAPAIIRGILIKALSDRGVMTPEANAKFGIDKIKAAIEKFRNEE